MLGGFPHSEIFGSKVVCQLPEAYRRLLRPSSPLTAKASTICAYSLDHITPRGRHNFGKNYVRSGIVTILSSTLTINTHTYQTAIHANINYQFK